MPITHAKVATFADQPGVEINKGEWNANHVTALVPADFTTATGTPSATTFYRGDNAWATPAVSPAGSTTQVQYNDAGALAGASGLTYNKATGAVTVTSSAATALTVGANGSTNPAFTVDASTASSATGLAVKSAAAGGGVALNVLSSATDESLSINSKGTSDVNITAGNNVFVSTGQFSSMRLRAGTSTMWLASAKIQNWSITQSSPNATDTRYSFTGSPDTSAGLTASTNAIMWSADFSGVRQHATGTIATQQDIYWSGSTHSFVAASTITDAAAFTINGASIAGTNASITASSTLKLAAAAVGASVTNSYGLNVAANTGATNNYIASLNGSAGEVLRVRTDGQIAALATNTAAGTTGAQTINKPSGTVNFAAAATSLVVTNSLCTTNSIIIPVLRTNDATARIASVVPGSGSFTINLTAAATAETSCGFLIIN